MAAQESFITVRTNKQERELLKQTAQNRGTTVANLIRGALKRDGVPLNR